MQMIIIITIRASYFYSGIFIPDKEYGSGVVKGEWLSVATHAHRAAAGNSQNAIRFQLVTIQPSEQS
ncbi:MAG: hypothetical protein COW62_12155, partial [Zetaproteobacteria bacterium CG17_big_fil_post_rev_8_21_14_2_50_50_13]